MVDKVSLMKLAPRCTATAKHSGKPCQSPAVKGFTVCRMHGARGGNRIGKENSNYRHGAYTREAKAIMDENRQLLKVCQNALDEF